MDIKKVIAQYDPTNPLSKASTPPSLWYTEPEIAKLEIDTVFSNNWLIAARIDQLAKNGDYVATEIAKQPIVLVKGESIKAFYNVCRHHGAQVMETGTGCTRALTCPYHAWSYKLNGNLCSTPKFDGVENFNKSENGLIEVRCEVWQKWVFVCLNDNAPSLTEFLGSLNSEISALQPESMSFHQRVSYQLNCNWKVYVDNYLDGGYHVPILHKGLNSALDGKLYKIETKDRFCLQSCPTKKRDNEFSNVRTGTARYYWQYPNLMLNLYDGIMGIMIVEPISVDKCVVIFDYFFDNSNPKFTAEFRDNSVTVANKIQDEDTYVCESVQRGLASKGYDTGRLSVEKEAGEHLFHKLLFTDLSS
ncbi:aromatic ring-hydroxylating oxygenase subunit alpha [Thalassotalea crassostreae]|uniref:aromatic ring-hydroxylating oxygenase subunit alpha n=1 Tax=Thalassotalea crassostreae TaxID=1763536 RepID=UPI00083898F6|nr:aromatic ring-hydroxylating dioxygenase subunit alpha [Thalassotalea crassostreae]